MGETCVVIKAEAIKYADEIKRRMENDGFIPGRTTGIIPFTQEISERLYSPDRLHYPTSRINEEMSGHIWFIVSAKFPNPEIEAVIVHSKGNTIEDFISYRGPTNPEEYRLPENKHTLRANYGLGAEDAYVTHIEGVKCRFVFNGTHSSGSEDELKTDKEIFF